MATLAHCNLNSAPLKNRPLQGFEPPTFVSTVLCDQATGSAMDNAPALQEERADGHVRPKQEVMIRINVYMDVAQNKDHHKPPPLYRNINSDKNLPFDVFRLSNFIPITPLFKIFVST